MVKCDKLAKFITNPEPILLCVMLA